MAAIINIIIATIRTRLHVPHIFCYSGLGGVTCKNYVAYAKIMV